MCQMGKKINLGLCLQLSVTVCVCLLTVHVQWALDPHDTVWLLRDGRLNQKTLKERESSSEAPSVSGLTIGVADSQVCVAASGKQLAGCFIKFLLAVSEQHMWV